MTAWALWFAALIAISLEGAILTMFGADSLSLQVGLVAITYLGLRWDFSSSAWVVLGLLFPLEWAAVGVPGVYSLASVVVFLILRIFARQFENRWNVGKVLVCGAAVGAHQLVSLFAVALITPEERVTEALWATMLGAVLTALVTSMLLGWGFGRIEGVLDPRKESDGLIY